MKIKSHQSLLFLFLKSCTLVAVDSINEMNLAFNQLQVAGVIINDVPTFRVDHMPYGGIKDSGSGREGVKYAIMDMLEPRLLVKNC